MFLSPLSISELPAIKVDGVYRVLACIPSSEESKSFFPRFSSRSVAPMDSSQWREIDLEWYGDPIKDQRSTSSCVSQGCTSGMEYNWMQSGRPLIEFNPYFVYGLINGGRDAGAMISDGLKALMQYGICLKNDLPPGAMFQNQFPQKAFNNAKRFKLTQAYRCDTFEEICSAITLGFVCPLGILVGSNFGYLDNDGVAPLPNGGGGGHCVMPNSIILGPNPKKAKDIKVGDLVLSHDGKPHKVNKVYERQYNGNVTNVVCHGGVSLAVTEDHPVLIYRRKRQGIQLSNVLIKENSPPMYRNLERFESVWVRASDIKSGDYLVSPRLSLSKETTIPEWDENKKKNATRIKIANLVANNDFAWLFGYYIGDGNIISEKKNKVKRFKGIEFSAALDDPIEKILSILKKLGLKPKVIFRGINGKIVHSIKDATSYKIRAFSATVGRSFATWFGQYCHEKIIPDWLLSGWNLNYLLDGLLQADGHKYKNACNKDTYTYYTVSEILANQVRLITSTLGEKPNIKFIKPHKKQYPNAKGGWGLRWTNNGKWSVGRITDNYYLNHVKHIYFTKYEGQVFNYEVEETQNYVCDGVVVHNCILGMGLKKSSRYGWLIKIQNSWGSGNFGMHGFCYIHKGHFQSMGPDAFAMQSIMDDPQDDNPIDDVPVVTN